MLLYVKVGEKGGFVIWELEKRDDCVMEEIFSVEALGTVRKGRMWVREGSLLAIGQKVADTNALMDKSASFRLGCAGREGLHREWGGQDI